MPSPRPHVVRIVAAPSFAALLLFAAASAAETTPGSPAARPAVSIDSDAAVRISLEAVNPILTKRDLAGFMALFENSDDILLVGSDTGEIFSGRASISGFLKQLYALPFTFSFDMTNVTIRRKADNAWAFVDGAMVHTATDGKTTRRPYRFAVVMVKHSNAWRWQLFHGSVPGGE
jgi:uncharacterized protein (TIGR02246 family)